MTSLRSATTIAFALLTAVPAFAEQSPVWVDVSVGAEVLDASALRDAIGKELECPAISEREFSHSGEIVIKHAGAGQISVAFLPPDRQVPLQRIVVLPRKAENRVQLIAWLVGNMARDEAAEWLAEHKRQKASGSSANADSRETAAEPASANPVDNPATPSADVSVGNTANQTDVDKPKLTDVHPAAAIQNSVPQGVDTPLNSHAVNLALWHGLLELHPDAAQSSFGFHLGVGYGRVGAIRGVAFDVLHHREDFYLRGVAGSLIWTRVSRTEGVAFSFGVVTAKGDLHGADLAQFVTYREGAANGVQLAGLTNFSTGDVVGGQIAPLLNVGGNLRGLQLAWGANVSRDLAGVQGSFVNVAKNVGGLQFGLINVAKNVEGVQIGLLNISDNVRTEAQLWAERNYLENVGVRYVYSPLLFGVSTGYDSANDRLRFLFGLGARFAVHRVAIAPSVDVGAVIDKARTHAVGRGHDNDVRLSFEWELVPRVLCLAAGPTLAFRSDGNSNLKPLPRWFAGLTLF